MLTVIWTFNSVCVHWLSSLCFCNRQLKAHTTFPFKVPISYWWKSSTKRYFDSNQEVFLSPKRDIYITAYPKAWVTLSNKKGWQGRCLLVISGNWIHELTGVFCIIRSVQDQPSQQVLTDNPWGPHPQLGGCHWWSMAATGRKVSWLWGCSPWSIIGRTCSIGCYFTPMHVWVELIGLNVLLKKKKNKRKGKKKKKEKVIGEWKLNRV